MVPHFNIYIVPADQKAAFLQSWQRTSEAYSRADGFIETYLYRNAGFGDATFQFIGISYWSSAEAAERVRNAYPPGEERLAGVQGHPAIFEAVHATRHRDKKPIYLSVVRISFA